MAVTRSRSTLPVLFGVVVLDLVGFGIVMPILPFYADSLGADAWQLGLLLSAYAAMQFVFAPLWGRLSDRIGRRRVLLMTITGGGLALVALGLAHSLAMLFAARLLGGAFAGNIGVATAYITDVTEASERTRWMGMLGASFGVGFLLGPAIAGGLAPYGYSVPMFAAAGLSALNLAFAVTALREPPRHAAPREAQPAVRARVTADPRVARLCNANLLFALAVTQLESMFAYLMKDEFGYDARGVAFILVAMAVVMGTIQGGGMRPLVARFGERQLLLGGAVLMAIGFVGVPEMPTVAWLLIPLFLAAVGRAVSQPSLLGLVSFTTTERTRGAVMGTFQGRASLARVFGPVVGGFLYDQSHALPFWLAAALMIGCLGLASGIEVPAAAGDASGT